MFMKEAKVKYDSPVPRVGGLRTKFAPKELSYFRSFSI